MTASERRAGPSGQSGSVTESACTFEIAGEPTIGIVSRAPRVGSLGVLFVVGGPQYRIGSHRQFVLLARALAAAGVACFRFDLRGMGDAGGERADFSGLDAELLAARNAFASLVPELEAVVVAGLCDGASAALLHASAEEAGASLPVRGVVAINPWIRTQRSRAVAEVRHHYRQRFTSADFWRRLLSGQVAIRDALGGFLGASARALRQPSEQAAVDYPERMAEGARALGDRVFWMLSGQDLVAREFEQYAAASPAWRGLLDPTHGNVLRIDEADHTFSREAWRAQVSDAIAAWLKRL